jgi:hypothetical protein
MVPLDFCSERKVLKWWLGTESNRRHGDFQSPALPTELPSQDSAAKRARIRAARVRRVKKPCAGYDGSLGGT